MADEADNARIAMDVGVCAGAASLVVMAFSLAGWADWIIEINEETPSGATPNIMGRQIEMLALGGIVVATSLLALVLRAQVGKVGGPATGLGVVSGILTFALVAMGWSRGWYYHFEHAGPLAMLVCAAGQSVALMSASAFERRE